MAPDAQLVRDCFRRGSPQPRKRDWHLIVHPKYGLKAQAAAAERPKHVPGSFDDLPEETLLRIAGFVDDAASVMRLAQVNTHCRRVCNNPKVWKQLCMTKFGVPPSKAPEMDVCWKELYRFQHEVLRNILAQTAAEALLKFGLGGPASFPLRLPVLAQGF